VSRSSVIVVFVTASCAGPSGSAPPSGTESSSHTNASESETLESPDTSSHGEHGDERSTTGDGDDDNGDGDDDDRRMTVEQLERSYGPDPAQTLDLYLPKPRPAQPIPIVVLAHGGLWQGGDKLALAYLCEALVERSSGALACASINYRLSQSLGGVCEGAGVDTYEQQVADLASAYALLQAEARTHGLDSARMHVGGHSAGGHLAHTLNLRWSEFSASCTNGCPAPAGAIGIEGIYDIAAWDDYDAQVWNGAFACATRKAFGGAPDSPTPCIDAQHQAPCWQIGSPTQLAQQSVTLGLAPVGDALIIHSPGDDWVDIAETPNFAAAMSAAFPELSVIASYDGQCGSSSHDNVLNEPALASCIVNFVTSNGASI
jgi:acetyl esterase/lipase